METQFKPGDTVAKVNGNVFSNGSHSAIVKRVDRDHVWFVEPASWLSAEHLRLEYRAPTPKADQAFKADAGKPRWSLLMTGCASALAGVVRVLTFAVRATAEGGKGYLPHSWKEVPNATERYKDALHRHLNKIEQGETHDDESGELHWHHVATNALFLAELNKDSK